MQRYFAVITLLVLFFTTEPTPVHEGCDLSARLFFHFHHSNFFHLLANASCIFAIRKIRWFESYIIAFLCSFFVTDPTVGISGILFSAIGMNIGKKAYVKGLLKCSVTALAIGLLPGVSLVYHLVSLLSGYAYGWCAESIRIYRRCFPT